MANRNNPTRLNFIGGEISPRMAGRTDLDIFDKALSWCQNFIILPQGPSQFRPGTYYEGLTVGNQPAWCIPFQFSANDAIMIVATNKLFRFYRNDQVILNTPVNITAISQASPAEVTSAAHGLTTGNEIQITGIAGMTELNQNFYIVTVIDANHYTIADQFGNPIDSTTFNPYISGGTGASIYQLATPYLTADLSLLRYAQVGDIMYLVCNNALGTGDAYAPEILTRSGFTSWTLTLPTYTNDPFTPLTASPNITAITRANPAVMTVSSNTGLSVGQNIYLSGVVGMTQVNGMFYTISNIAGTAITLADTSAGPGNPGNPIDSTGFTAYVSGGTVQSNDTWPSAVAFTADGRLAYGGSQKFPQGYWSSRLPTGATTRYNDFTTGSSDDFAVIFQFAPVNNEIDNIQEIQTFQGNVGLLGPSALLQVFGSSPGLPPNPNSVNTIPTIQGTAHIRPLVINWDLIFVDVNQTSIRGLQYNLAFTAYEAKDYNLQADHLGLESPFIKLIYTQWTQVDIIWCLRADGVLLSLTFNNIENIGAWARHYMGGPDGASPYDSTAQVLDIGTIRKTDGVDELWMIVQRTINGNITVTVEVMADWPIFPPRNKFYSGNGMYGNLKGQQGVNPSVFQQDEAAWNNAAYEAAKECAYLDMSFTYDGRQRGIDASATLALSAASGSVTITASQPVFNSSDVGLQIWKSYAADGTGGGQAVITEVTSSTVVVVNTTISGDSPTNFDNANNILPGSWAFATKVVTNLGLFNGLAMNVQADGGGHPAVTVSNSQLTLQWFSSVVQVGFGYLGMMVGENLDSGGKTGPANSKPRNVLAIRARFDNTIGALAGTSLYRLTEMITRDGAQFFNRPPPPFTGMKRIGVMDRHDNEDKRFYIVHDDPTPCTVIALDMVMDTIESPT